MDYEKKEFIEDLNELLLNRFSDISKDIKYFLLENMKLQGRNKKQVGVSKRDFNALKKKSVIQFFIENLKELSYEEKLSIVKVLLLIYLYEYNCCIEWITSQLSLKDTKIAKKYIYFSIERDIQDKELTVEKNNNEIEKLNKSINTIKRQRGKHVIQIEKQFKNELLLLISKHRIEKSFERVGETFEKGMYISKEVVFNLFEKKAISPYMLIKHRMSDEVLKEYELLKIKHDKEINKVYSINDKKISQIEDKKDEIIDMNRALKWDIRNS